MINFKNYLTEQEEPQGKPLTHLTHVEDRVIHGGHEGVGLAAQHLEDVHNTLLGKNNSTHVSTKYDGAPSIVFGTHPKTGQFFVASKSAFNKNPKINFTPEDIQANHGHSPGLAEKLTAALQHLPKIMPKNGGVYQGDMMYTKPDIEKKKGQYNFTPNAITYSTPQDSPQGKAIKNSEMGVVVHTQYGGGSDLSSMSAGPLSNKQREKFDNHPDVHNIDPTIKVNPSNYTHEEQRAYLNHMGNAKQAYAKMKPEGMDALQDHGVSLETHVNDMVRKSGQPSVQGYMDHLTTKSQKDIDKVKTQAAKDRKMAAHADLMKHISENQNHFKRALEIHGHLQQAKNILTGVMAKNSEFGHSINGEATGPEGAVAVDKNGNMSKFVDRNEFSRQNLLGAGRFQKQPVTEGYLLEAIMPNHVTTFMRANPPTAGHAKVVDKVLDIAKDTGGSHSVVLSHSQDPSKNPLSPTQKLKHARNAFPNANVQTSSEEAPSLLHHAVSLHNQGVKNLHLVVGQDRVGQFEKLLNNYNGKESKHGYYNFDSINVHSAGDRDPDAEGVEGVSGTMMRKAAKSGDRNTFHSGSSAAMSEKHKDDMMRDVVKGMSIKEEAYVPNEGNAPSAASLSASGAPQESGPLKKKKTIKENTTGSVGGLGFNTGNPAPNDNHIANYVEASTSDADTRDNVLKGMINKSTSPKTHEKIGFKAFDPSKDLKAKK